jgi:ribonucleoside-diphosphate reductase subunit M1
MDVASVINHCIELKTVYGKPLDGLSEDAIADVVRTTATTVQDTDGLFSRVAIEFGNMQMEHYQYGQLAARVLMSQIYSTTPGRFCDAMRLLYEDGKLSDRTWKAVEENRDELVGLIDRSDPHADFNNFTYQGVTHLTKSYLLRSKDGTVIERPKHTMLRVALGINPGNFPMVAETFGLLLDGTLSMASPIMFNAGTTTPHMASCFIQTIDGTNPVSKYEGLTEMATISSMNGGVGMNVDGCDTQNFNIVVDRAIKDVPQGGVKNNKRPGAGAVYREPWETDFLKILSNKRTEGGREDEKHKDLFIGMWTPSIFVRRLEQSVVTKKPVLWSFFCGAPASLLRGLHGREFDEAYERLEADGAYASQTPILDVYNAVCLTQKETGTPYVLFKDIANRRSNHGNRGTIRGSNLCAEILEYSDASHETAVCTLASICVSKFLRKDGGERFSYDFDRLGKVTRVAVRNLNETIDLNLYPSEKTRRSHTRMRPLAIGIRDVQGLFFDSGLPFTSGPAKRLLERIMAEIYYAALDESRIMALERGRSYDYFEGSMYSRGILQQDTTPFKPDFGCTFCGGRRCEYCSTELNLPSAPNWEALAADISRDGLLNSLVTAIMPTVGTAQIFGHYEAAEPMDSLVYLARVNSGTFQVVCGRLVRELESLGMWTDSVRTAIVANGGSIRGMTDIPQRLRDVYMTVWEIKQKERIKMAATYGRYVDQGISFNVFLDNPTSAKYLTLMLFSHNECDMKIANYYHRSKAAVDAKKVVLASALVKRAREVGSPPMCSLKDGSCCTA